jgi:very-short-patch-repair endonuclease
VLRAQLVAAETKLWNELRNRQLGGFKFVRQAAIGPYDSILHELEGPI